MHLVIYNCKVIGICPTLQSAVDTAQEIRAMTHLPPVTIAELPDEQMREYLAGQSKAQWQENHR